MEQPSAPDDSCHEERERNRRARKSPREKHSEEPVVAVVPHGRLIVDLEE
jgi:hypothetical protein